MHYLPEAEEESHRSAVPEEDPDAIAECSSDDGEPTREVTGGSGDDGGRDVGDCCEKKMDSIGLISDTFHQFGNVSFVV